METAHVTCQASNSAPEDVINIMPKNVVSSILGFLPIQDAVRTSILSKNWRYNWTMLTQLVFGKEFFEYILRTKGDVDGRIITRVLAHLEGVITKFALVIPNYMEFDVDDIYLWAKLISGKGMNEFALINMKTPIELPAHLFSCVDLKHLRLHNCYFRHNASFCGFRNLLSLDFSMVSYGELITLCPLLEVLKINHSTTMAKVKPVEIAKLENIKELSLSLCALYDVAITSSDIFKLVGFLPKLHKLTLDFQNCKFMVEAAAGNRASSVLHSLKSLMVFNIDYDNRAMVLFFFDLIHGSPNLHTLKIMAVDKNRILPSPVTYDEVNGSIMGNLQQLRKVELVCTKDSEVELSLITSLLSHCSMLDIMFIANHGSTRYGAINGYLKFCMKLLMLPRASPTARICFSYK